MMYRKRHSITVAHFYFDWPIGWVGIKRLDCSDFAKWTEELVASNKLSDKVHWVVLNYNLALFTCHVLFVSTVIAVITLDQFSGNSYSTEIFLARL